MTSKGLVGLGIVSYIFGSGVATVVAELVLLILWLVHHIRFV